MRANQPAAHEPRVASRLHIGHHRRGVGEPDRQLRLALIAMNTRRHLVAVLMLAAIMIAAGCQTRPICILYAVQRPVTAAEVVGFWMGFTNTDTDLYRLELRADRSGTLTQVYTSMTNQETLRFEVSRWDITTNNGLTCSFTQHDIHEPVILTGQVMGDRLEALLRNAEGGWKESIVFWREQVLDEKLRVIRQ